MSLLTSIWRDKKTHVTMFSSTAIALYGYDQGMMSLINTNYDYLGTMGIAEDSPLVGVIVAVYYLGCSVGAIISSTSANKYGRKPAMFIALGTATLGSLIMFMSGLGFSKGALPIMLVGRVVMGLGVGGIDCVVPTYSSELMEDNARGKALAQEFQANILGLNLAFAINLACTYTLGKYNQWAWRIPIIFMNVFSVTLMALIGRLPESPRYWIKKGLKDKAKKSLARIYPSEEDQKQKFDVIVSEQENEDSTRVEYKDMLTPGHPQFHPTIITIMGQINQMLTGYGAVSVYGPQIFELLGFSVAHAEFLTMGNYISYLILMTFAWLLIDVLGRRSLMVSNSVGLVTCFLLLTLFGGLASNASSLGISILPPAILGTISLFVATGNFGIGWLATIWLIPTEIYPQQARSKGTAISVIVWGLSNFAITLLTPIFFNNLSYWLYLIFAATNLFAGLWTYFYLPETGGRSFEENLRFFDDAKEAGTWRVSKVSKGEFRSMPGQDGEGGERQPLLRRVREQVSGDD